MVNRISALKLLQEVKRSNELENAALFEVELYLLRKKKEDAEKIVRAIKQGLHSFNLGNDRTARRLAMKIARDVQRVYTEE